MTKHFVTALVFIINETKPIIQNKNQQTSQMMIQQTISKGVII